MQFGDYWRGELWSGVFRTRNWPVLAFGAVAYLLGLWGFSTCTAVDCQTHGLPDKLFRTLDLIRMTSRFTPDKHPWPLVIAQLMMPLALVAGAIRLFIVNIRRDLKVVMIRRLRGHVIVCGLGDIGNNIAQQLAAAGHRVVAISLDNQDANALACERRGILVLRGDGMEAALLEVAGLHRAAALFVACGTDATNIEIALRADDAAGMRSRSTPLQIWIELRFDWLYAALLGHRNRANLAGSSTIRLFNFHANAARVLVHLPAFAAAAGQAETGDLLLIGQELALGEVAAQALQGPLAVPDSRATVTMLAARTNAARAALEARYPGIGGVDGFALEPLTFDENGLPDVAERIAAAPPFAVVIEFKDEVETMRAALRVRELLDRQHLVRVPVFARIWRQAKLGGYLAALEDTADAPARLIAFGGIEALTAPGQLLADTLDRLAIAAHEAYRASPGNGGAPEWAQLSEAHKQSNRDFADQIPAKLARVPLSDPPTADEIERLAELEHLRWSQALRLRGWRHGARDPIAKRHPLLVDWSELDDAARETNREMVRRIPDIIARASA